MKLKFIGTKGEIEEQTPQHRFHSSLLLEKQNFRLLIDHGLLSPKLSRIKAKAILITHAHPDHFLWLKKDEDYQGKIYLTRETAKAAKVSKNFVIIKKNHWFKLGPFKIFAYPVAHSLIAPAVGFKIKAKKTLVYNPDILFFKNKAILKGVDIYIGDSSSVTRSLVRKKDDQLFGHARIQTQINWCKKYQIRTIIFTHLGKEALGLGKKALEKRFKQENLTIKIASDGFVYEVK